MTVHKHFTPSICSLYHQLQQSYLFFFKILVVSINKLYLKKSVLRIAKLFHRQRKYIYTELGLHILQKDEMLAVAATSNYR